MNNTNITLSFQEKIKRADRDFGLFECCDKILVGLSGGADSTCLLLALNELSKEYGFELFALHVNHLIRGDEASRDEDFARNLCRKHGIKFFCERVDVPSLSKQKGESLELCARNERYSAFERVCIDNGISYVATAHNACDNAETIVFNLVRGTGIKGLCGIPPKRELVKGITVIRPLIYADRSEIEEYLESLNQPFVTDSTNSDTDYTRNFIRNSILPLMRSINPELEVSLGRMSGLLRSDEEYINLCVGQNMTDDIAILSKLHKSVLSRVIMKLFDSCCNETPSQYHVSSLCDKIYAYDGKNDSVSFPGSMSARLERGKLFFVRDERKKDCRAADFKADVKEGEMFFKDSPYALYITFDQNKDIPQILENDEIIYKKYTTDYLYFDTIPHVLFVRNRQDGDKIFACGMNKSIKRIMNDSVVCPQQRYLVPFVCDGTGIVCVPGTCVSDRCKKGENKEYTLCVSLYTAI